MPRLQSTASSLFSKEQFRQRENVGRIEKIEIRYLGTPKDTTLIMNQGLSTPHDCAKRKYLYALVYIFRKLGISAHRFETAIDTSQYLFEHKGSYSSSGNSGTVPEIAYTYPMVHFIFNRIVYPLFIPDIGEKYCRLSALALLDNHTPWDMRRPLEESCTLQLLNFTSPEPHLANKAFWRTCSFLLGAVLQKSFKEEAGLFLHSFPKPNSKKFKLGCKVI